MPLSAHTARLVLDTNVWLDWLVFADPGVAPVQRAVANTKAIVFMSTACGAELARVLGYPLSGRALTPAAQAAVLAACRAVTHAAGDCAPSHDMVALPRCADPDDQKFLELARDCRADALITKDRDLLALAARKTKALPFRIVTPREFAVEFRELTSCASSIG